MSRRDRTVALITLSLLQVFTLAAASAVVNLTPPQADDPRPPSVAGRALVQPAPALPALGDLAQPPSASALAARLADLAKDAKPRISAVVVDVDTGRVLFDRDAQRPSIPASTTKLVTSVAALSALGPGHRITTKVVQGGDGGIVLVGGGDPTLTARTSAYGAYPRYASLDDLARQTAAALTKAGVRQVRVDYDTSLYVGPGTATGWKRNYLPDGEVAPMSALTVDEGRTEDGGRVEDPASDAAEKFARLLDRAGVNAKAGRRTVAPKDAPALGAVQSPPVSALVEHLMTVSDNDVAEALIRQVAIKRKQPASFDGGARAVMAEMRRLNLEQGIEVHDGSGLSTRNRITPLALARLASLAASDAHPELRPALTGMPVAGFTGTLAAPRYTGETAAGAGTVRAKTGTLSGVSTLAGVVQDARGRLLAFAFMLGDGEGPVEPRRLDRLAAAVAACC
ncbi:D-alanyl-D-alanine carboxypeptidase/D-alanyl-D-alanine endopeptidase [Thermomonospora cellulosilytica]|uniref:D-alanyl-D-alanine carboxypeptidase/D-alanyl-D-alanine-endopeptidase (Penicillin-binding protein 4) n=1 Tax=Thermomonospora cellulosilytica TaxID=1411118 RepID=A0A7W3R5V7_9ACTN|nr:D-alanyl-D-alanine carboxypeptidase/D-alanyl-D-alanine-endopeptidase [Thermomonospora cellulosilytica]MBA9001513.1 D-alanyl-D-alanine carboxypeptidase/D-alanyl-D-alanine-endopeptidase (penicillin-binding protein 4) [Thermomonospora cellulosilytica]